MKSILNKCLATLVLTGMALLLSCAGSQSKIGQVDFVTIDEELRLGSYLRSDAAQQFDLIRNQHVNSFLNEIGDEIGEASNWAGLDYRVFVVNDSAINHFSLPGGNIYIYRGILELCSQANEIAGIIAHEIAHLAGRHSVERFSMKYGFAFAAQSVIGENPEISSYIVSHLFTDETILDYPEHAERTADAYAVAYMRKANYRPYGLVSILNTIRKKEAEHPSQLMLLSRTHSSSSSRYKRVRKIVDDTPVSTTHRSDVTGFADMKKILEKIPY